MKRHFLLFFFSVLCLSLAHAQNQTPRVSESTHSVTVDIDLIQNKVENPVYDSTVLETYGPLFTTRENLIDGISIEEGELVLRYHLPERDIPREFQPVALRYVVTPTFRLNGQVLEPAEEYLLGDWEHSIEPESDRRQTIRWTHLLQDYINLEGQLSVTLKVAEFSNFFFRLGVDCTEKPEFGFEQKWPHYAAGLVGGGLLIWALVEELGSNRIYNDDYLPATSLSDAMPHYDRANRKHQRAIVLAAAGAVILIVDGFWYNERNQEYRRQKRKLKYCFDSGLTLAPSISVPSQLTPDGQIGLRLTIPVNR